MEMNIDLFGEPPTAAEIEAFHQWEQEGFAEDKRMRLLRSDGPISEEQRAQWQDGK